ncbi:MAG: pyruvate kinase alpha/beta domain-containing protein [Desulfitobacteriaceae bacterium]|nr:pyruvate kinase alpha/beta domain-containing protein [Desulfitobacteriaceae bacterium]MDD4346276.1 pyruvate kinase alpha/beta domain-containing protein [Desulfitobacteriaceae bacterium]MDD4400601.1 pyruvate kinase alpha/beta domain-containing protein [Desulfitobacteriaceae bacterium]
MYFNSTGKANTKETITLALKTAREKNIDYIIVASSSGDTCKLLINPDNTNIICVTHAHGYPEEGKSEMLSEVRYELTNLGIKVLTTTHVLSGAERCISKSFGGVYPVEIIAHTLRMLGQGTKVCVEISVMALDAGLIPYGKPVIAIGGSGEGADTALILTPSHASSIFKTKVHEIICKPSLY